MLDHIKAIALVADGAVLESVTQADTRAATGPVRLLISASGGGDATPRQHTFVSHLFRQYGLNSGRGGVKLCVTGEVLGK